jgi:hypothetical protein
MATREPAEPQIRTQRVISRLIFTAETKYQSVEGRIFQMSVYSAVLAHPALILPRSLVNAHHVTASNL